MLNLIHVVIVFVIFHCVYPTRVHPQPALPPCGSYRDCSTGQTHAHNWRTNVPSLASCYLLCYRDPECTYYSYNYSQASHFYRHCFLIAATDCVGEVGTTGWVSAPLNCNNNLVAFLQRVEASNNGLLRATK